MKRLFTTAILLVFAIMFGFMGSVEAKESNNYIDLESNETNRVNLSIQSNEVGPLQLSLEEKMLKSIIFQDGEKTVYSLLPKLVPAKNQSEKIIRMSNSTLAKKYYVTNPKIIMSKKKLNVYKKRDFTKKNYKKTYAEGTVLKVKKITKSKKGIPQLELTNGYFISAHKNNVLKISAATQESFYTANDNVKKIMTLKDLKTYRSATATTKGKYTPKYTVFYVNKISYNGSGKNRFQLRNGQFISASKIDVVEVPDTIENYYREERTDLQTQKAVYSYDNLMFGETKNSTLLPIGTNIQVVAVVYNRLGYPRFELSNGEYVSTKKTLYRQIPWYER